MMNRRFPIAPMQGQNPLQMLPQFQQNPFQALQQLQQNPVEFLRGAGLNLPSNMNNPNEIIQHLMNSGQISQQQYDRARQAAQTLKAAIK